MKRDQLIDFVRETHDRAQGTDIVERAKSTKSIHERTWSDYERVARARLDMKRDNPGQLLAGVSRQSYDHHRAALLAITSRIYSNQRKMMDKAQREGDLVTATQHARAARRAVDAYRAVMDTRKPIERSAPRKSKRRNLPRGDDWQRRAWDIATPTMKPAVAAGWVGARPAEIELGISVERTFTTAGMTIIVTIPGAKTTERSGQPSRKLYIDPRSAVGEALAEAIPDGEDGVTIRRRAKRISLDWSQRIRPQMGGKPSAYSLRHQFAANLKAAGLDPVEIAKALGHLSVKSQGRYGSGRQGQGTAPGLITAEAEREVRTGPDAASITDPDARDPSP